MSLARQRAVYRAEDAALAGRGRTFRRLAEVQRYVDRLVGDEWWARRWPEVDGVVVGRSRSRRWDGYAVTGAGEIRLATLSEPVLLHELAHLVTPGAGHGPAFTSALLDLVRRQMGFHAYGALLYDLHVESSFAECRSVGS